MAEGPFIYRFVRDLRLDDHAGLAAAAARGPVLPLLVIDRALEARLARSPRRAAFFCAAVRALDGELRERGSSLIVRRGPPGPTMKNIAHATAASGAAWAASYDRVTMQSDGRVQSDLEELGLEAFTVHDAPAIAPEETAAAHSTAGLGYRASHRTSTFGVTCRSRRTSNHCCCSLRPVTCTANRCRSPTSSERRRVTSKPGRT